MVEAITFCLAGGIVYMCRVKYPTTYNSELDTFDTRYRGIIAFVFYFVRESGR